MIELSQKSSLVSYDTPPPAPMAIFTERVRHPDNVRWMEEAEARLAQFHPMPKLELYRVQFQVNRLHSRLRRLGVIDRMAVLETLRLEYENALVAFRDLRSEVNRLQADYCPTPPKLFARGREASQKARKLKDEVAALEARLLAHQENYARYLRLCDRLDAHIDAVRRRKQEQENKKQFLKEGKIIDRALKDTFMMTEGCHVKRLRRNGKVKRIPPKFQEIYLNSYVHQFVLLTSKRTLFGGYKNVLQVDIHNLVDPKTTLKNASAILHRQVYIDYDSTGSLPIFKVNRLDVQGGLPERVNFAGVMEIYPVSEHDLVPIPVGLGENFRAKWMNLELTPHILIAGATRSGKSNFSNAFLCSLIQIQSPDEVRILAIDGKAGVEFFRYRNVPHLIMPVIDDADKILSALVRATSIMNRRFNRLKDSGTTKILEFNRSVPAEQRMPRLVIFIDEMLTLTQRDDTEQIHAVLANLTAKGAAAGVHVVMATQYPNAEVIPPLIKNNCDGIIGLRMANVHGSLMLFQTNDAYLLEKIKGRAFVADAGDRYKAQTVFIPPPEIDRAIRYSIATWQPKPFAELEESDTAPMEVLPPTLIETFGEEDVLAVAFEQFDGALKADKIWNSVRQRATANEVRKLVQEIRSRETVDYNGRVYRPKLGAHNTWYLVQVNEEDSSADLQFNSSMNELMAAMQGAVEQEEETA